MKSISVNTAQQYNVLIGSNLLTDAGTYIKEIHATCKAAIISDSNVWPLYGSELERTLNSAGYLCRWF